MVIINKPPNTLMEISFDFTSVTEQINLLFNLPIHLMMLRLIVLGGWIPLSYFFLWMAVIVWKDYSNGQWLSKQKYVLLAIDVPRNNMQSPRAVENMFSFLLGAHSTFTLVETWWLGVSQLSFSFEIVSIEGYTQYLIRSPEKFRDLVEAAIFSQYPDAEITEVNDYAQEGPKTFPDDEWDIFGCEFYLPKNAGLPIKTYPKFEHQLGDPDTTFRDPMSSLMSLYAAMGKGEQLWYQIIAKPIDMFEWTKKGENEIKKILNEKIETPKNILDNIADFVLSIIDAMLDATGLTATSETKDADTTLRMMNLKPREKKQIEAIQEKVSKPAYDCKVRFIYLSKHEVKNKPKAVNGFVGFMKQYADMDLNNLKPDTKTTATSVSYFFVQSRLNERKRKIMSGYRSRSSWRGLLPFQLNTEELASLWHFPLETVTKAPMLYKVSSRKAEPPSSLPMEETYTSREEGVKELFWTGKEADGPAKRSGRIDESVFEAENVPQGLDPIFLTEKELRVKKSSKRETEPEFMRDAPAKQDTGSRGAPPGNLPFV